MMLIQEPPSGQNLEAFNALDDTFGADEFSEAQGIETLSQYFGEEGTPYLSRLIQGGYVSEV